MTRTTVDVYGTSVVLETLADDDPQRFSSHPQYRATHATSGRALGILTRYPWSAYQGAMTDGSDTREYPTRRDVLNRMLCHTPEPEIDPSDAYDFPELDYKHRRLTGTATQWRALAAACSQSRALFNAQTGGTRHTACTYCANLAEKAAAGTITEEVNASVWFDYLAAIADRTGWKPETIRKTYGAPDPAEHAERIAAVAAGRYHVSFAEPTRGATIATAAGTVIAEQHHVDLTESTTSPEEVTPAMPATTPAPIPTEPATATLAVSELRAALAAVKPAVGAKMALPILAAVRLTTTPGVLTIAATNLELFITEHCDATTSGRLDVCVPHAELGAALKGADRKARATITQHPATPAGSDPQTEPAKSARVTIAIGGAERTIPHQSPEDFPVRPMPRPDDEPIAIDGRALSALLRRVEHAAAADDSRPVLSGIYLHASGKRQLSAAACDGFTLSAASIPRPSGADDLAVIFPARAARAIIAAQVPQDCALTLATTEPVRKLKKGEKQQRFPVTMTLAYEGGAITSRLIEGTFPDYTRIFPNEFATTFTVDGPALAAAVTQLATVAKTGNDVTRLETEKLNGTLPMNATNGDGGKINVSVPVLTPTAPTEHPIALNWRYLADVYAAMGKPQRVRISLNTPQQCIQVDDPDETTHTSRTVIMPMVIGAH